MKQLDIDLYFGFDDGYTAEDIAYSIDFTNKLYDRLKEIYLDCGDTNLQSILATEDFTERQEKELKKIINSIRDDLISNQHYNGDDIDPETGEEYDFSELIIDMEIVVPDDWYDE